MNKYQCRVGIASSTTSYYVIVIANSEWQAREIASGHVRESGKFEKTVRPESWDDVDVLESVRGEETSVVKSWSE